jgi:hypothetical protein
MRIVMTLATLLALSCGAFAGGLYAGDEPPCVKFDFNLTQSSGGANFDITPVAGELCRITPPLPDKGDCDTSVYQLEHARADQIIGRVKSLVAQIAAYAADENVAGLPKSLVLLPTSSGDAIIAICPKAHASLVKHAIKSCDTLKQYAVKIQLFEVADTGKTIPVGGPHLLIGRSGNVQSCVADDEAVNVTFTVDALGPATGAVLPNPPDPTAAEVSGTQADTACNSAGRCHLDCPPPIGEMSVESESDPSGIVHFSESNACDTESCGQGASCPGCKSGTCTGDCCKAGCCHGQACSQATGCKCDGTCCTSGQCTATSTRGSQAATCSKAGACLGTCDGACGCGPACAAAKCCESGCCEGKCGVTGCECNGKCGAAREKSPAVTSYEWTGTEAAPCQCQKHFSVGFGFGPALHLVGPIVWFNKGDEPRCAACETSNEMADSDDGHECDACNLVPPPPAEAANTAAQQTGSSCHSGCCYDIAFPASCSNMAKSTCKSTGGKLISVDRDTIFVRVEDPNCSSSSCTDGCPILASGTDETTSTPAAPCSCEEPADAPAAPGAEPPALLTLSQHKDPSASLPSAPRWQEEMLKLRGLGLSQLFESHSAPSPEGAELGRLLAEFPKHAGTASTGHGAIHNLTIVDMPDRVRIFESNGSTPDAEKITSAAKTAIRNSCPNCREEFRAFLEEMFRSSESADDIAQTSHHEGEGKASETARDLPNVTHSKIATATVSYPLRDLVLCDDAGRPVFDTCTIIDHLQATVSPESWSHPSVSIQLDQQSVSLVVTQTAEVHQKIADHLRYLRRLQVKQICSLIERLSADGESEPSAQSETLTPTAEVDLGLALPIREK